MKNGHIVYGGSQNLYILNNRNFQVEQKIKLSIKDTPNYITSYTSQS
jgi:hypothetical protein